MLYVQDLLYLSERWGVPAKGTPTLKSGFGSEHLMYVINEGQKSPTLRGISLFILILLGLDPHGP